MTLRHKPTQQTGTFIKEYEATYYGVIIQIRLADGRIYFAPKHEFELIY